MRVYRTECRDKMTGFMLVAEQVTYNEATYYLSTHAKDVPLVYVQEPYTVIKYPTRTFYYNEKRGVLLGN